MHIIVALSADMHVLGSLILVIGTLDAGLVFAIWMGKDR